MNIYKAKVRMEIVADIMINAPDYDTAIRVAQDSGMNYLRGIMGEDKHCVVIEMTPISERSLVMDVKGNAHGLYY